MAQIELKYKLSDKQRNQLRLMRTEQNLSAENVSSELLHKSKGWLAMLERGRIANVKETDLIKLLSVLHGKTEDEILSQGILEKFLNINGQSSLSKWFQDNRWDNWVQYNDDELFSFINKELKTFSENIKSQNLSTVEPNKLKYIIWRTLQAINANLVSDFELFSLVNCTDISVLENETMRTKEIETEKLYKLYLNYEKYRKNYYDIHHPNVDNELKIKSDVISVALSACENANKTLLQILNEPDNHLLIESYNKNIKAINGALDYLELDMSKLELSTIENIFSDNVIYEHMTSLLKSLKELNRQKDLCSIDIKEKIESYTEFLIAQMIVENDPVYVQQKSEEMQGSSEISGIPLSEKENRELQELFQNK